MWTRSMQTVLAAAVVLVLMAGSRGSCQETAKTQEAPAGVITLSETPVRNADAHLNNVVMMKGVADRYKPEPTNTSVYALTDQYGDAIAVRSTNKQMALGKTYTVVGVVQPGANGGKPTLSELRNLDPRSPLGQAEPPIQWDTRKNEEYKPEPAEGSEEKPSETEDSTWMLYAAGGGMILIAVILGAVLAAKSKREREAEWLRVQEQKERELRDLANAAGPSGQGGSYAVPAGPAPATQVVSTATAQSWGSLKVVEGPDAATISVVPLTGKQVVIGRKEGDVVLSGDESISGRHSRIAKTNDGRLLYIDDSTNGSVVSGKPVHHDQVELKDGDEIQVGVSKLKLSLFTPAASSSTEPASAPTTVMKVSEKATELFTGCELKVIEGSHAGQAFPLGAQEIHIGRGDDASIQLTDSTVSRKHAVLTFAHGVYTLTNESSSGTLVNGERVTQQELKNGDEIQMGGAKLQFTKLV